MLTRTFSASRKILLFSLLVGLFAAIAVSGIHFLVVQKKHEQKMNAVLAGMQHWLTDYFSDIKTTAKYYLKPDITALRDAQRLWERALIA